ncbi:Septum formation initiator family protein [Candidatus Magnetomoraceae bacterium gMMP-15]
MDIKFKILAVFIIVIQFLFLIMIALGDQGGLDLYELNMKKNHLIKANKALEIKNLSLYRGINRLKHDPIYIESIARSELGMIGKNELVYEFRKKKGKIQK